MKVGDIVTIISDNVRLPKGTTCEITNYSELTNEYYIRNVDSQYCCWVKPEDIKEVNHAV